MEIEEINKLGIELTDILKLKTSPVAVSLIPNTHEIPQGIERIEKPTRHCQMIDDVRHNGSQYYTLMDDQACKGGAAVMGFHEMEPNLANGDVYFKLNSFSTINAARRTMQKIPMLPARYTKSILYAPIAEAKFIPDVVVIVCNPKQVMQLSQALLHRLGGRVEANFAGKQSLCADGVAQPYKTGQIGVTVGCSGSRKNANIDDDEMVIGIPIERLHDMVEAAKEMFT